MPDPGTDPLSPLSHQLIQSASYDALVVRGRTPAESHKSLSAVTAAQLLTVPVRSSPHAHAMLSGLWLRLDALEESHKIAQADPEQFALRKTTSLPQVADVDEPGLLADAALSLNFWHAIMHRREGDFSNSKYWYNRCAQHGLFPSLAASAAAYLNPLPADKAFLRLTRDGWDPAAFVDLVQTVEPDASDPRRSAVIGLQQLEWRMLFDWCTRKASGL